MAFRINSRHRPHHHRAPYCKRNLPVQSPLTMATPLPNATNSATFPEFLNWANTATGSYFGIFILALVFLVTFFALKRYTTGRALIAASAVSTMGGMLLRAMGLIPTWTLITFIILLVASTMYGIFADD